MVVEYALWAGSVLVASLGILTGLGVGRKHRQAAMQKKIDHAKAQEAAVRDELYKRYNYLRAAQERGDRTGLLAEKLYEVVSELHERGIPLPSAEPEPDPADAKPFDPLDPMADKAFCQRCPKPTEKTPFAGLHPVSKMRFPPSSLLWLCPDCYDDFMHPEKVLDPGPTHVETPDPEADTVAEAQARLAERAQAYRERERHLKAQAEEAARVAALTPENGLSLQPQHLRPGFWAVTDFKGRPIAGDPVLRQDICSVCLDKLESGYGLVDGQPTCAPCMGQLDRFGALVDETPPSPYQRLGFCEDCAALLEEHDLSNDAIVPEAAFCKSCRRSAASRFANLIGPEGWHYVSTHYLRDRLELLDTPASPSGPEETTMVDELSRKRMKKRHQRGA